MRRSEAGCDGKSMRKHNTDRPTTEVGLWQSRGEEHGESAVNKEAETCVRVCVGAWVRVCVREWVRGCVCAWVRA
eukprot:3087951-Pleurochrysis_carterae.AAC.2